MTDPISRRDLIKGLGAIGASGTLNTASASQAAPSEINRPLPQAVLTVPFKDGEITNLTSTSEVFIPPRGRAFMKFSFDFPEPVVAFGEHRFGFLVFTAENAYGLDREKMRVEAAGNSMTLKCDGFVWAGGQERARGSLTATFRKEIGKIEWDVTVEMEQPIKTVTTVIRDVPRGQVSFGGGALTDPRDNELLSGYPFGGGDLHGPGAANSMSTPLAVIQTAADDFVFIEPLDDKVRPKRFYFQPGENFYRVEAIYEHDGWRNDRKLTVPRWRLGYSKTFDGAIQSHMNFVEAAFQIPTWDTRKDVPDWARRIALVTTLHGMHYTGYMFNDYAKMLEILRWISTQIPADRVLAFLSSWDGRYYWDYPNYKVPDRMGGEAGFRKLIQEGQKLGFKMMPMFGANAANRRQPAWPKIADGSTRKIDGDVYNLNWVDWNNDRHQDGWLTYMNLGVDSWRNWLEARISDIITGFGVDAYFLDIIGGHVNDASADMHEGTRRLVMNLRAKHPNVFCVGEMPYDALHAFIPMYHAGGGPRWQKYSRFFQHLSSPAPGRGSSGVHEAGFGRFNIETLSLSPNAIPTRQVVDDTVDKHREVMKAIIGKAKERAGIG
ncbi:MAG: hypothetical protein ACXW18_05660 [Pyrinomonadaceae bacterium]